MYTNELSMVVIITALYDYNFYNVMSQLLISVIVQFDLQLDFSVKSETDSRLQTRVNEIFGIGT